MARNALGMYFWPRDFTEEDDIVSVYLDEIHWCLYDRPDQYRTYSTKTTVDKDEILIGPKVIVEWSE